jgi:hypothetical protein
MTIQQYFNRNIDEYFSKNIDEYDTIQQYFGKYIYGYICNIGMFQYVQITKFSNILIGILMSIIQFGNISVRIFDTFGK